MKKLGLLTFALFTFLFAQAQSPRVGLKLGTGLSSLSTKSKNDYTYKLKLHGGLVFNYGFSEIIQLQPEVLYAQKGYELKTGSATINYKTSYIDVPVLVRVNVSPIYVEVGPQASFLLSSKQVSGDNETDLKNNTKSTVFGLAAGIGYMANNLNYGFRLTTDISDTYVTPADAHNIGFNIYIGFFL